VTGKGHFYANPMGVSSRAITDTQALAACQ